MKLILFHDVLCLYGTETDLSKFLNVEVNDHRFLNAVIQTMDILIDCL